VNLVEDLLHDLRQGVRMLRKNPGFAAVAVLTLALGIGVNSAIFSLVDAVILRPLPYPDPEQLVGLGQWRNQKGEGYIQTGVSAPNIGDIAKTGIFQQVAYYRWSGFNVTEGSRPESVDGIKASAELLPMFGIPPQLGRYLAPEEMQAGHDQVAIIGHSLWQMRYGSDPAILGKTIELDERRYTIVGVMPASFRFTWDQERDVFVPLVLTDEERSEAGRGTSRDLQTQARLKGGVSIPQAQAAMNALADSLAQADEMIQASDAARRLVVINTQFPYMNIHTGAKKIIGSPEFGRLLFLQAWQSFRPTDHTEAGWRGELERRLCFEFGIHVFELIRYFFDDTPSRILAHMPHSALGLKSDSVNIISVEFADGRAATVVLNRISKGPERYLDLKLDGEHASVHTSIGGHVQVSAGVHTREKKPFLRLGFAQGGRATLQDGNREKVIAKDGINPFASATARHFSL